VPFFSEHFQTIVFDNRDVGRSSHATGAYKIADIADDVASLLNGLGVERAHLVEISMGGMICQEFAVRHPNRLNKAVLTGTGTAPARAKSISIWSFVKIHDSKGLTFTAQQFLWLFCESFRLNHEALDQTLQLLVY